MGKKIIGLVGLIGSGKNAAADTLIDMGFQRMSFASKLKDAVAVMFSWDRELLEGITAESREFRETVDPWWADKMGVPDLTPRWVLQHFGTNVVRNHFNINFWIYSLERALIDAENDIVISDCRFQNELALLQAHGTLMCITRGNEKPEWWNTALRANTGDEAAIIEMDKVWGVHESEWAWAGHPFRYMIANDGTLDDLDQTVRCLVQDHLDATPHHSV